MYVTSLNVCGQTFKDVYDGFKQQAQSNYKDFRQKANKEYAAWMRKVWEWHQKIAPMPRPKDEMIPPVIYLKSATIIQYTIKGRFMSR